MPPVKKIVLGLMLSAGLSATHLARAGDTGFVYFRSDHGQQTGTGPLPSDLEAPDSVVWRVALDSGHSSPIISAGKIFLTTFRAESKELAVVALDEKTGEQVWRVAL